MGISRLSALIIINSEVEILPYGPYTGNESPGIPGKYGACIVHSENHQHHPHMPILTAAPVYDSAEDARSAMLKLIEDLKKELSHGSTNSNLPTTG